MVTLKDPLVLIPPDKRKAADFLEVIYKGALEPYYHLHDNPETLTLMEDRALVHRNNILKLWQEASRMKKLDWLAQSLDLNPIENIWKICKDEVQKRKRLKS
jgi:transposase